MNIRVIAVLIGLVIVLASWGLTCAAWRLDRVAAGVIPLDPRSFESLTAITLGTGAARENQNRRGPSTAIAAGSEVALVDVGRGVAGALRAATIPVSQPASVLLTSLLPENVVGLDDLVAMGWIDGRREPLRLVGPAGTRALAEATLASVRPGLAARAHALSLEASPPRIEVTEIADGWSALLGDVSVRAGALPGGPLAAFAYRFERGGRSVVVGGPGWAPEALIELAMDADLLVHEAAFVPTPEQVRQAGLDDPEALRREAPLLTSLEDAGDRARKARVGTLVLVRLRPPPVFDLQVTGVVDDHFGGRIVVADDGDEFTP
jgi:ribonuclease BN (tRNA processing enzyme)